MAEHEEKIAESYELEFVRPFALIHKARALIGLRRFALAERTLSEVRRGLDQSPDPYLVRSVAILRGGLYSAWAISNEPRDALLIDPSHNAPGPQGVIIARCARSCLQLHTERPTRQQTSFKPATSRASTEVRAFTAVAESLARALGGTQTMTRPPP